MFSTDKPISVATIKQLFKGTNVRTKDIMRGIETLMSEYASPQRGVTLEEVHGGYQLRTKVDNAEFMKRMAKVRPFRLSGPALEVMAIVAYKQPITKHEIDEIRGVESGHLLRALMERGLVSFEGKSDLPGKPMTYGSTRKFLETFGLRNLKELPTLSEIEELLPEGIGEVEEERETLSDITDSMAQEIVGTYSEGEEELRKINDQLQAVDTTTEFFEQEKQRERERRDRERAQDIRERLVLGDAVEEKDRRWLDRYEAKLAAGPATDVSTEVSTEGEALADKLEALTEESAQSAQVESAQGEDEMEAASDESWMEVIEDGTDDLDVRPDWDEDSEGDKEA
jgi:segregation and condensation protein B